MFLIEITYVKKCQVLRKTCVRKFQEVGEYRKLINIKKTIIGRLRGWGGGLITSF